MQKQMENQLTKYFSKIWLVWITKELREHNSKRIA